MWQRWSNLLYGVGFLLFGGYTLLLIYGFASMVNPLLSERDRAVLIAKKMLDPTGTLWGVLFSTALIVGGSDLIRRALCRTRAAPDRRHET